VRLEPRQQQPKVILAPDQRVRVFISSTPEELAAEREVAAKPPMWLLRRLGLGCWRWMRPV